MFSYFCAYIEIKTELIMTETEVSLIEGLRKQKRSVQQQMLDSYGRDVFAQIARLIPGVEDVEEVYQDVFVKVFRNIGKYDGEKSSLRTWVSRIAYNETISFLRKKPTAVISYEDHGIDAYALTDAEVEETFGRPNAETVQLIRAALKHLPSDERAIITMFYYEEMSLKEIAYVTESIPTTIASKLSRTRRKLCRIIKMIQS